MYKHSKIIDAVVLLLLLLIATWISLTGKVTFLMSTFLFFGLPAVYLSWRSPQHIKKTLFWTLIPWFLVSFIFEYLAYVDQAWLVLGSAFRFLNNSFPIEDVPWGFLWAYLPIIFWKHFLDKKGDYEAKFPKRIWWLIGSLVLVNAGFFWLYFWAREWLYLPYFYLVMGIIFCVIPISLFIWRYPMFLKKLTVVAIYFTFLAGLKEYVALKLNYWVFPGTHFIGTIFLAGQKLPLEEIIFFLILSAPAMVCWYEYFADDRK